MLTRALLNRLGITVSYLDGVITTWSSENTAPALKTRHLLGHQAEFRRDPLTLMLRARQECGDLVRLRFGPLWFHLLSDPGETHAILAEKHRTYSKRTPGYQMLRTVLGDGLVTSEGDLWRRQRRIAQPAFQKKQIAGLAEVMRVAARDQAEAWQTQVGENIDIAHEMSAVTLRIAGETLFAVDLSDDSEEVSRSLNRVMHGFTDLMSSSLPFLSTLPTPSRLRSQRALVELDRIVHQIIDSRRRDPGPKPTLLNMLMDARDEEGKGMSDKQLRDEVITLLLAGHETTANALTWTFYMLSKHPAVTRRLEAELDEVLNGQPPTMEQARELVYTTQVIKEAMRLYPPVWMVGRRAEQDDEILGYQVHKGALVLMSPYVLHRHPDLWENPEGFDPDRFAPDRAAPRRGAYIPFITGPRKCIGEHFAMLEAVIMVATLLARYRLELVPGHKVGLEPSVTLRPDNGVMMRLRTR